MSCRQNEKKKRGKFTSIIICISLLLFGYSTVCLKKKLYREKTMFHPGNISASPLNLMLNFPIIIRCTKRTLIKNMKSFQNVAEMVDVAISHTIGLWIDHVSR